MAAILSHECGATISIYAQPRASRTEVAAEHVDWLTVRVAAPPTGGAANMEIVQWLSKQLKIPKSDVELLSGDDERLCLFTEWASPRYVWRLV